MPSNDAVAATASPLYAISVRTLDGRNEKMGAYEGKTLLIVNVASRCGFTPQYAGLESLYREFQCAGLVVMGFPSNQFAHQEPGNEAEIREFCTARYSVSFPLFAKVRVNGPRTHPLYRHLKSRRPGLLGRAIKWNFTKFLVDDKGRVRKRYAPITKPQAIARDLNKLLNP